MSRLSSAARAASHDDDLAVDYSERAGFLTGKSAALADWAHRKEQSTYDVLFKRLYARNHARLMRERDPEGVRAKQNAWREANREHVQKQDRTRKRGLRMRQLRGEGVTFRVVDGAPRRVYVVTCDACRGASEKLQPTARFCSRRCANRWHGVPRARARNRGVRNMTITATVLTVLEIEPLLTLGEIHRRAPETKYHSLATLLCGWVKDGTVVRCGGARFGRYALPTSEGVSQ